LISDGSDGATLLLWLLQKTVFGKTSAPNGVFDLLQYQHHAAYFLIRVLKIQIRSNVIHYFQRGFD
jgi:hypothetical protein